MVVEQTKQPNKPADGIPKLAGGLVHVAHRSLRVRMNTI
jgi:hypothetical protein